MALPKPEEDVPKGSPSASTSGRFPNDQLLRLHGWVIHARPKKGPALWRYKDLIILPEDEALEAEQHGTPD